jgi:V8-like Glu-specific endopeptidase
LKFIGLIRSKFSFSHTNKIGTGIVIAPKIVLTVAHNITQINHKTGNLEEAEWIEFYPGNNGKV